ncbi:MAG: hypothetical protein LBE11_07860 [Prevotellaceae bacterium]|jgi:hypothetical protein|nr:hypothetical protein [Prevotellaceae bacterium]
MNYIEKILTEISRINEIVEKWKKTGEIAEIERKIAKDYLARIYDKLSVVQVVNKKQPTVTEKKEERPAKTVEEKNVISEVATKVTPVNETQQHQPATSTLGETLQKSKRFLSDDFAESDVLLTPIKDLTKGIGLNDKFLFAKELFGGNAQQFSKTVTAINDMNSIEDALEYIKNNFSWQDNSPVVKHFITLVRRRFM